MHRVFFSERASRSPASPQGSDYLMLSLPRVSRVVSEEPPYKGSFLLIVRTPYLSA